MNTVIDEIKKKIDIVEFIGSFITLKKSGRNFKAICPFHQEKTPSFVVSPERQIWHCFGSCNEGGDIIKFLMKWENITFIEALRELAEKAGVKLQRLDIEDKIWNKKERLMQANHLAAEYFTYILFKTAFGKKAQEYLKSRQINSKIAQKFQLGYAPQSWDSLLSFLQKKKFSPLEISDAGLVVRGERGGFYDRFRGRLIFPIKDSRGNAIGFSGRSLDEKEKAAKYINTPETMLYHKRESLYGIDLTKEAIKKARNVLVVEGEFDVIVPYEHGIENVVAIKGSAVTREQLMLLKRYTDRVTLALDADASGEEAAKRGIDEARNMDLEIEVMQLDFAKDPDEAVRTDPIKFKQLVKKSTPIYDFIISLAEKNHPEDTPFNKKKIGDEVVPYLERIENPILQIHYTKKLAEALDVTEGSINELIRRYRNKKKQRQFLRSSVKPSLDQGREINIQRYVLSVLFQSRDPYSAAKKIFDILELDDFSHESFSKLATLFLSYRNAHKEFDLQPFVNELPAELRPVFDELYLYATYDSDLSEVLLERLLLEIKKNALKRKISKATSKEESFEKERTKLKELSSQLKEVEKRLLAL